MEEDGELHDSGFDGGRHFRVTPDSDGVSLDSALRDFGPAAIDDLIPRARAIAAQLDAAHADGVVHGALHPSKVIVMDLATSIVAGTSSSAPYLAPEVVAGGTPTPASDQYALAAIVYEWLFGRPIAGPAERTVEVRNMPGVERVALAKAFTRALAPKPGERFGSCTAFCDAVGEAVIPETPLLALEAPADDYDPVEPFVPEAESFATDADLQAPAVEPLERPAPNPDDLKIVAEESFQTAAQPDLDAMDPRLTADEPDAVPAWNPGGSMSAVPSREPQRFGGAALILATIVGAIFGFAAGYMARPRALQSGPPQTMASAPATDAPAPAAPAEPAASTAPATKAPVTPAPTPKAPATKAPAPGAPAPKAAAAKAPEAPKAPQAPERVGRILVRSNPSGASVSVDGVAKGSTPIAVRDLALGTRSVVIARQGYLPETRSVTITAARAARTLDVQLSAESAAPPLRPSTPATIGRPASTRGSLQVDSRPSGAAVSIDGKPAGSTPLTVSDLAPGDYRVEMVLPGYRNFATTVRVVAGERVRAAASLTAQEQE